MSHPSSHQLTKYESLVREIPIGLTEGGGGLVPTGPGVIADHSGTRDGHWYACSCGRQFPDESSALDHLADYGDGRSREGTPYVSDENRHIAGLVFTHALPEDVDLVLQTLGTSEFLRVDQVGANYADIVVKGGYSE